MEKEQVLRQCEVVENTIKLPPVQLDRKVYLDVKKSLELIGGKWKGGKTQAFVFPHNSSELSELLGQVSNGEKRNLKKEFQFFETPADLADDLVSYAAISPDHDILEPSAGQGAIVRAINRAIPGKLVDCYEIMPTNLTILTKIPEVVLVGEDFLNPVNDKKYDRIIANPPWAKNQDIDHVTEMYRRLKSGGRIVTLTSNHWLNSSYKKESQFAKWMNDLNATLHDVENGTFKSSGTMVGGVILIIDKP